MRNIQTGGNKIHIKFVRFGSHVQAIETHGGSKLSDIVSNNISFTRDGSFYRQGKIINLNSVLRDGDIIVYAFPIRGEATVRRNGKIWVIHKNDNDIKPSDFHMHNYQDRETLDLYTGFIYRAHSNQKMFKLSEKEHKALLSGLLDGKEENFRTKAQIILSSLFPN